MKYKYNMFSVLLGTVYLVTNYPVIHDQFISDMLFAFKTKFVVDFGFPSPGNLV